MRCDHQRNLERDARAGKDIDALANQFVGCLIGVSRRLNGEGVFFELWLTHDSNRMPWSALLIATNWPNRKVAIACRQGYDGQVLCDAHRNALYGRAGRILFIATRTSSSTSSGSGGCLSMTRTSKSRSRAIMLGASTSSSCSERGQAADDQESRCALSRARPSVRTRAPS